MISFNRKTTQSRLLCAGILLLWLLSVPGLRPAYHQHLDEKLSEAAIEELADHLRIFRHDESTDPAELHMHWLVQLDGNTIPSFPNAPIPLEQSNTSCLVEALELTSILMDGKQSDPCSAWASFPFGKDLSSLVETCSLDRRSLSNFATCRFVSQCATTLYCASCL